MTAARFLETRRPVWEHLEALVRKCGRRSAAALTEKELHELTRLYPAVAVDVARARMLRIDRRTQERINALAIAAHGLLYRRRHVRPLGAVRRFLLSDYPRLFRRMWAYLTLATLLFALGTVGAYVSVRLRPAMAHVFVPHGLDAAGSPEEVTADDVSERYRKMPKPPMATLIMGNNISVAFHCFALGITAGVGTCYVMLANAMMVGAFFAHFANHNLSYVCYSFLVPHGALEIFAIVVSAAAGLRLGLSLAVPGALTRMASLRAGAREAVGLVLGTIPMFLLAGAIEAFVTPTHIPGAVKIAIGAIALGATLAHLLLAGRETPARAGGL